MGALDTVIRGLERELDNSKSAYEGILSNAADNEREPNDAEKNTLGELTNRMDSINKQLSEYDRTEQVIDQFQTRSREIDTAMSHRRREPESPEYATAGAYIVELVKAASGSQRRQGAARRVHPSRGPPKDLGQPRGDTRPDRR